MVRELADSDDNWKRTTLEAGWGSTCVARLGELIDAGELPGIVAELEGRRVGLATFVARSDGVEVATLQALTEGRGIGRSLMDGLRAIATELGAPRLWLITTNNNVRAFAFYQSWGMNLVARRPRRGRTLPPRQAVDPRGRDQRHRHTPRDRVRVPPDWVRRGHPPAGIAAGVGRAGVP